jgi:hypothetical protein
MFIKKKSVANRLWFKSEKQWRETKIHLLVTMLPSGPSGSQKEKQSQRLNERCWPWHKQNENQAANERITTNGIFSNYFKKFKLSELCPALPIQSSVCWQSIIIVLSSSILNRRGQQYVVRTRYSSQPIPLCLLVGRLSACIMGDRSSLQMGHCSSWTWLLFAPARNTPQAEAAAF